MGSRFTLRMTQGEFLRSYPGSTQRLGGCTRILCRSAEIWYAIRHYISDHFEFTFIFGNISVQEVMRDIFWGCIFKGHTFICIHTAVIGPFTFLTDEWLSMLSWIFYIFKQYRTPTLLWVFPESGCGEMNHKKIHRNCITFPQWLNDFLHQIFIIITITLRYIQIFLGRVIHRYS